MTRVFISTAIPPTLHLLLRQYNSSFVFDFLHLTRLCFAAASLQFSVPKILTACFVCSSPTRPPPLGKKKINKQLSDVVVIRTQAFVLKESCLHVTFNETHVLECMLRAVLFLKPADLNLKRNTLYYMASGADALRVNVPSRRMGERNVRKSVFCCASPQESNLFTLLFFCNM